MSTTMYMPMPEWQAMLFLRDRGEAFNRMLAPVADALPCEVMSTEQGLCGFRYRKDAVEYGHSVYPEGFAMVRFVFGKFTYGNLSFRRLLLSATDDRTRVPLWNLTRDGISALRAKCLSEEAEVLVDQLFGGPRGEACTSSDGCAHEKKFTLDDIILATPEADETGRPAEPQADGLIRLR